MLITLLRRDLVPSALFTIKDIIIKDYEKDEK